ncbi:MAG: phosphatidylserine decarboxylase, partial [Planctomycetia bacterium]
MRPLIDEFDAGRRPHDRRSGWAGGGVEIGGGLGWAAVAGAAAVGAGVGRLPGSVGDAILAAGVWVVVFGPAAVMVYFFRDPPRRVAPGVGPDAVLSPADGRVLAVFSLAAEGASPLDGPSVGVRLFLSLLDVHLTRAPAAGRLVSMQWQPGRYFNASTPEAAARNARRTLVFVDDFGRRWVVRQIAGLVARRLVCWLREGETVARGDRVGLIKFGSCVEILFPADRFTPTVQAGDRVRGGETSIGRWTNGDDIETDHPPAAEDRRAGLPGGFCWRRWAPTVVTLGNAGCGWTAVVLLTGDAAQRGAIAAGFIALGAVL